MTVLSMPHISREQLTQLNNALLVRFQAAKVHDRSDIAREACERFGELLDKCEDHALSPVLTDLSSDWMTRESDAEQASQELAENEYCAEAYKALETVQLTLDTPAPELKRVLELCREYHYSMRGLADAVRALIRLRDAERCKAAYSKGTRWILASDSMRRSVTTLRMDGSEWEPKIEAIRQQLDRELPIRMARELRNTHQMFLDKLATTTRRSIQQKTAERAENEFADFLRLKELPPILLALAERCRQHWADQCLLLSEPE